MSEENSEKIIVRKDTIVRCGWCGTPESTEWLAAESGEKYCSPGCLAAATESRTYKSGIVSISCSLIIIIPLIVLSFVYPNGTFSSVSMSVVIYAFILLLMGLGALMVSRDSRKYCFRKGMYGNISTSAFECQYCDYLNPPNVSQSAKCFGLPKL